MKIIVLIPVFNDWISLFKLLENIDNEIKNLKSDFSIIVVNDASTEIRPNINFNLENIKTLKIINMRINQGHARCNATGLKYIYENEKFDHVIPMDGDGEDRPEEIKNFINKLNKSIDKPIVGERIKRSEGFFFKFCYLFHKFLTTVFTGHSIKFGNYTCISKSHILKMIKDKATWSSYSGSLAKNEKYRITIPSERGARYSGPSKMSFSNLVKHSLSIIAVFKINVLIRSILFCTIYIFLISQNISIVTLIPIFCILIFLIIIFLISTRENFKEYSNSLSNIENVDKIEL